MFGGTVAWPIPDPHSLPDRPDRVRIPGAQRRVLCSEEGRDVTAIFKTRLSRAPTAEKHEEGDMLSMPGLPGLLGNLVDSVCVCGGGA